MFPSSQRENAIAYFFYLKGIIAVTAADIIVRLRFENIIVLSLVKE
jgi:hypothetical protein